MKFSAFKTKYGIESGGKGKGSFFAELRSGLGKKWSQNTPAMKARKKRYRQLLNKGKSSQDAETSSILSAFTIENFQKKRRSPNYVIKVNRRRKFKPSSKGRKKDFSFNPYASHYGDSF